MTFQQQKYQVIKKATSYELANFILNYFGEFKTEPCGHCDRCIDPPKRFDGTILSQIALSACLRLNQQVNLTTLVDVIRALTNKILFKMVIIK